MATSSASLSPCEDDPTFLCTTVPVPLNRRHPDGRMVNIHVEVFPHTGPAAEPEGAVFVTCGGPGCSATLGPKYGFSFFVLPEIAETRDLVYVDQRGVGLSDVIDCPQIQAGVLGELYSGARACHDQLGDTANLYATVDVADDLDDVRAALGYDQIDLFGGSYAGNDMITYAVRHRAHVRSAVLASPAMVVGVDPFYAYAPKAMPGVVAGVCGRSPACHRAHPHPARDFARFAARLRHHPVTGVGDRLVRRHPSGDGDGEPALQLLHVLQRRPLHRAWRAGARSVALRHGDRVPLMRLASDNDPANGFGADLREFSNGHSIARSCVDAELAFDKEAPARVRVRQYAAAYAAEPDFYGVVSKRAWAAPDWLGLAAVSLHLVAVGGPPDVPGRCTGAWCPDARPRRGVRPARTRGRVADGDQGDGRLDLRRHDRGGSRPAVLERLRPELVQRFYRDLDVGDTSCADQPAGGWWVPGSFPTQVRKAPPADPDQRAARVAPGSPAGHRHRVDRHGQRPAQLLRAR